MMTCWYNSVVGRKRQRKVAQGGKIILITLFRYFLRLLISPLLSDTEGDNLKKDIGKIKVWHKANIS
jgi:hypothetical protein